MVMCVLGLKPSGVRTVLNSPSLGGVPVELEARQAENRRIDSSRNSMSACQLSKHLSPFLQLPRHACKHTPLLPHSSDPPSR